MGKRRWVDVLRGRLSLIVPEWRGWGRLVWCIRQQRALVGSGGKVVWVRGPELAWATWGARHGLFAIERMDGLPYLQPSAPANDAGSAR
ncbi:hypothetical protein AnaeK_2089 [Anaeromyxobacter sp. K]|uniref:hypothetical protein n=1 Tax=Anaeromyxobacter sp. (strain K) TaxID=447217 RepID=UPI00015F835A|nr:hypothetical protein [Anaeromyxobacter sp. K]ACG73317.1 hypothetical protein AnaeK_2089 [Anaeromyxobacter sp. K]